MKQECGRKGQAPNFETSFRPFSYLKKIFQNFGKTFKVESRRFVSLGNFGKIDRGQITKRLAGKP